MLVGKLTVYNASNGLPYRSCAEFGDGIWITYDDYKTAESNYQKCRDSLPNKPQISISEIVENWIGSHVKIARGRYINQSELNLILTDCRKLTIGSQSLDQSEIENWTKRYFCLEDLLISG